MRRFKDMQQAVAGLRSLAEPVVETIGDLAELRLPCLACRQARTPPHRGTRGARACRCL